MAKLKQVEPRKAVIKKSKGYKFGQRLGKGEEVFIYEKPVGGSRTAYTAVRKIGDTLEFGVTRSEFEYTENAKFIVSVTRVSYSTRDIVVEAKDHKQAMNLADEKAGDLDFSEQSSEYQINGAYSEQQYKHMGLDVPKD